MKKKNIMFPEDVENPEGLEKVLDRFKEEYNKACSLDLKNWYEVRDIAYEKVKDKLSAYLTENPHISVHGEVSNLTEANGHYGFNLNSNGRKYDTIISSKDLNLYNGNSVSVKYNRCNPILNDFSKKLMSEILKTNYIKGHSVDPLALEVKVLS